MGKEQLEVGNATEELVANFIFSYKYCVYPFPKKNGAQPFDMIAAKEGKVIGIDAKHVEAPKKSFPFCDIQSNQELAMYMARHHAGIQTLGFAIKFEIDPDRLFWFSYDKYIEMKKEGAKSVNIGLLQDLKEIV